jgi:flagellum-specific peptidoglycan hydrolase FlgJ
VPVALGPITSFAQQVDLGADGTVATRPASPPAAPADTTVAVFAQRLRSESARQVEARRTPLAAETAMQAIADAYTALTGATLSDSAKAILTAQWAHETGHGSAMYNFNFGGIKGVGPSGLTVAQRTREGYAQNERKIVDNFRAYANVEEGAQDYVRLLLSRYRSAVAAAQRGDSSGFVRGLKDKGYFTGDPVAYERSIVSIAKRAIGSSVELQSTAAKADLETWAQQSPNPVSGGPASSLPGARHRIGDPLAAWRLAPTPTALLDLSSDMRESRSLIDGLDQLTSVRALEMSDEVTRAALRIAMDDNTNRRSEDERGSYKR